MLFDSTVRRELARSFGATLVVILTIVITMMLIRTLGLAAGGAVACIGFRRLLTAEGAGSGCGGKAHPGHSGRTRGCVGLRRRRAPAKAGAVPVYPLPPFG